MARLWRPRVRSSPKAFRASDGCPRRMRAALAAYDNTAAFCARNAPVAVASPFVMAWKAPVALFWAMTSAWTKAAAAA